MAFYWCTGIPDGGPNMPFGILGDPNPTGCMLNVWVTYLGSDVPALGGQGPYVIQGRLVQVSLLFTDTPATILAKVTSAIVADAASIGITVARNGGFLPSFIRGA